MTKWPVKDYGDTSFITGLRAIAVMMVVMIHAGGAGLRDLGVWGNNVADLGRTGVYIFFVISGFSIASSYTNAASAWDFISRRLLRILPLYYFWVFFYILLSGRDFSAYNLIYHFLLISWTDVDIANSILNVEWSIPVEVFWYLFCPAMMAFSRRPWMALLLMAASLALAKGLHMYVSTYTTNPGHDFLALHYSPFPYGFSFVLGIAAWRWRSAFAGLQKYADFAYAGALLVLVFYTLKPGLLLRYAGSELVLISVLTFGLLLIGGPRSFFSRKVLLNRYVQFVGVISYGIYLCHMPVMYLAPQYGLAKETWPALAKFVAVAIAAIVISAVTYYVIERPTQFWGKRWLFRRSGAPSAAVTAP